MVLEDEGKLHFEEGWWQPLPRASKLIADRCECRTVQFELLLKTVVRVRGARGTDASPGVLLAPPVPFEVTFTPGPPEKLVLTTALDRLLPLRNGTVLPSLTFACCDRYDHIVQPPTAELWSVALTSTDGHFNFGRIVNSVATTGLVNFENVEFTSADDVTMEGCTLECYASLIRPLPQIQEDKRDLFSDLEQSPSLSISIDVIPARIPQFVKVSEGVKYRYSE